MEDCATCRFFAPKDEGSGGSGDCRRHAPVIMCLTEENGLGNLVPFAVTLWPQVGEAEGCGEWESAPEFEEVEPALPPLIIKCGYCLDGAIMPPDETADFTCPKCGANTLPF